MGVIKGNDLGIFVEQNGQLSLIGYDLNCSIHISAETISTSSKGSGKWTEKKLKRLSWEVESEYLYSSGSMDTLFDLMTSQTPITVAFSIIRKTIHETTRDDRHRYYGEAYITDLSGSGNLGSAGSLSIQLVGTGELKKFKTSSTGIFEYKFEDKFE